MKNQRMKTMAAGSAYAKIAIVVLMIATLLCCFTLFAAAANVTPTIDPETDLSFEGFQKDASGVYYKTYDGANKTDVKVTIKNGKADLALTIVTTALAFCMVDMFDTLGTLYAACERADLLDE